MTATKIFSMDGRRIWVAGHKGMAGSAIVRRLTGTAGEILTVSRPELDLRRQSDTEAWMAANRPEVVFVAAATVGGIVANSTRPAEFLFDNLAIAQNVIHGAYRAGVSKLVFLAASCTYPRAARQPLTEDALLTGPLEPTNEWYAVAKIAGMKLCQAYRRQYGCDFISAIPTNLYGPYDNYDLAQGHVVAAMISKIHQAKLDGADEVTIWGSGTPTREFLDVDDMADALVFLAEHYSGDAPINVGTGIETSILGLAHAVARAVGYEGRFALDSTKPDGMPRKLMDVGSLTAMGWRARTGLDEGLIRAYRSFLDGQRRG